MPLPFLQRTLRALARPRSWLARTKASTEAASPTDSDAAGAPADSPAGEAPASHENGTAAETRDAAASSATLSAIAASAVRLAALGPKLARLAAEMEQQAGQQAQRTTGIAATMDGLTASLNAAVGELRTASQQVSEALGTVSRIADHTRIISINASIEAARAGEHGRAFAVVVEEVQRLADRTGNTSRNIEDRLSDMNASIRRVETVSGADAGTSAGNTMGTAAGPVSGADANSTGATGCLSRESLTVGAVNAQLHDIAASAAQQSGGAASMHRLGDAANALTDALLLAVGRFRFDLHRSAERDVSTVLPLLEGRLGDRDACESALASWLARYPHFELAYLTDAAGRQYVDNIARTGDSIVHDKSGHGRDWSDRPWFLAARSHDGIACTDIYRSTANQDYCFTVTATLRAPDGALAGVFAADLNFRRLVEGME